MNYEKRSTYQKVSQKQNSEVKECSGWWRNMHSENKNLDPFSAQHAEYNHEGMKEIGEIPPGYLVIVKPIGSETFRE